MQFVYILRSKSDHNLYVGCTSDIKKRFRDHNRKLVLATAKRAPFELVFYEVFSNPEDAYARERWLKTGYGRRHIRKMLPKTLKNFGG